MKILAGSALALAALGACSSHRIEPLRTGATARVSYVLAQQPGPIDDEAIRTSFTAGLNRAQIDPDLLLKVSTSPKGPTDAVVEVRLGPPMVWDGQGVQLIDLPVRVRVLDDRGKTLWRFDMPCSAEGWFQAGLTSTPPPAPHDVARRHKVAAGSEVTARPIWTEEAGPFVQLGSDCGTRLVKTLNGR